MSLNLFDFPYSRINFSIHHLPYFSNTCSCDFKALTKITQGKKEFILPYKARETGCSVADMATCREVECQQKEEMSHTFNKFHTAEREREKTRSVVRLLTLKACLPSDILPATRLSLLRMIYFCPVTKRKSNIQTYQNK